MKVCSICLSERIKKESTTYKNCKKYTCLECGHTVHELSICKYNLE